MENLLQIFPLITYEVKLCSSSTNYNTIHLDRKGNGIDLWIVTILSVKLVSYSFFFEKMSHKKLKIFTLKNSVY